MSMQNTKFFITVGKIFLSIFVLWFLVQTSQIQITLFTHFYQQPFLLGVVIFLFISMIVLGALRWHILNTAQGIMQLSFLRTIFPTYLGTAFNNLLPGAVGGDFVRFYYLTHKKTLAKGHALFALCADRVMGLMGVLVMIGLIAIAHSQLFYQEKILFNLLVMTTVFCLSTVLFMIGILFLARKFNLIAKLKTRFPKRPWILFISELLDINYLRQFNFPIMIGCLLISTLIQVLIAISLMLIAKMMDLPTLSFSGYALAIGVAQIVNLIPITPGGIGVGEIAFANLVLLLNPGITGAFATVLVGYRLIGALLYLPGVLGYIPTVLFVRRKNVLEENLV